MLPSATQFQHQRLNPNQDEALVAGNWLAASEWVEKETNHAFLKGDRVQFLDCWRSRVVLWPVPLVAVTAVSYVDADGVTQTVDPSLYSVSTATRPGELRFKSTFTRPELGDVPAPITISLEAGYPDPESDAPPTLLAAVRILASQLFENREAAAPVALHEVPMGVRRLLEINRFVRLEGE